MALTFSQVNTAIHYTVKFYDIWKIKEYMLNFAKPDVHHTKILKDWEVLIMKFQQDMDVEITEAVSNCTQNAIAYLFQYLREYHDLYSIQNINTYLIKERIEKYNERTYSQFEEKVFEKEVLFKQSENYNKGKHNFEYDEVCKTFEFTGRGMYAKPITEIRKVKVKKFFCIEEIPEIIDSTFLFEYINVITPIIDNFRRILSKHINLYDKKAIGANIPYLPGLESMPALLAPNQLLGIGEKKKIKLTITVNQLAYLFKLLMDNKIIEYKTTTEVAEFITENFETNRTKGLMSLKRLLNTFSDIPVKDAKYWLPILKKMRDDTARL